MAQKTQKNVHTATETASEAPQSAESSIRQGVSLFALGAAAKQVGGQQKQAFMGDIRQKLAQVADEAKQHGEQAAETEALADQSATRLYQARIAGMVTADETSALLGDVFGYKPKQDGTPGKTPAGAGETIRKRVVRAVQGWDFVNGGDGGRFYETMNTADVAPVINAIGREQDGVSIWHAYKMLGDIKSQLTVRLPFAFDPKKILSLTESLSEAGAREKLIGNPSLLRAYGGLFDQLAVLNQVDSGEVEAITSALGIEPEGETETETDDDEQVAA